MRPLFLLALSRVAMAQSCPPPEIPTVADGDTRFDPERTREVLSQLASGVEARAGASGDSRRISHAAYSLWERRRQLDCALAAHRVRAPESLQREISSEAKALLDPTQIAPPFEPARLELVPQPAPPPPNPRNYQTSGAVVLGGATALLAASVGFGVAFAEWRAPAPCGTNDFVCFNDLDRTFHDVELRVSIGLGVVSGVATVLGAVLLDRGARLERQRRVTATGHGLRIAF